MSNVSKLLDLIEQGSLVTPVSGPHHCYVDANRLEYLNMSYNEQVRFLELYHNGTMRMDTPGYFFILPHFLRNVMDQEFQRRLRMKLDLEYTESELIKAYKLAVSV